MGQQAKEMFELYVCALGPHEINLSHWYPGTKHTSSSQPHHKVPYKVQICLVWVTAVKI